MDSNRLARFNSNEHIQKTMNKKALITGISGQDGSYLTEYLLSLGYEVFGIVRRHSVSENQQFRLNNSINKIKVFYGDLNDVVSLQKIVSEVMPDEIYNLGAQSHVQVSFTMPQYTGQVDAVGAVGLLEAIRSADVDTRFYQASTSELYGSTPPPQNELSMFRPQSPYAAAKLMAYWCTVNYRDGYGMHATNGILFNHESPRRGETFVTRKITRAVAAIKAGKQEKVFLGNLTAVRDWGYAKEYVESMWLMLQQDKPSDYVVATGVGATVKDFAEAAFSRAGLNWQDHVETDKKYIRPTEVDALIGDPSKVEKALGWKAKTHWKELAELMVDADIAALK